jgi:chemotaxis signal transduction protein
VKENMMGAMEKMGDSVLAGAREYLTFRLDQEEYGIDILKVQEIRGLPMPRISLKEWLICVARLCRLLTCA